MAGAKAFRKIQLGLESTPGTPVAATALYRGVGALKDDTEIVYSEEDIGYIGGASRNYIPKIGGTLTIDSTEATFEQLPYWLEAGIEAETPTQDGTGSDYIYVYNMPTTAVNTTRYYTLEFGDNQQAEEMEYSFVSEFTLEGNAGEAWKIGGTWMGRQVTPTTFTGAIALPTVEDIVFQKTKLYIDDEGGTIGTTQKSNTLLSATLSHTTGLVPVWTADGNLYFSFVKLVTDETILELTFEHDGTAVAEKAKWKAGDARLIRLLIEGSAVATPGTTYSNKTLIIDLAGRYADFEALSDQDGNNIINTSFRVGYSETAALKGKITVVNELTALP